MAPQIAWIGLGNMGRGMCKNLVDKGNLGRPLILFNRTLKRATDLEATLPKGTTKVASTLEEAVNQSDMIFTCLGDDSAVEGIVAASIKCDVKGKLFVDCSTIHPDTTSRLASALDANGVRFVACPVFGAPVMAERGQLLCVLAGPAAAVAEVKPYCKGVMGRAVIDFSDQLPSKATLLKVIGNTFVVNMIESLAEGHTLAEKSGLGTENLTQFIETIFPGPYMPYSNRLTSGDYYKRDEPLFGVDLARKDTRHALNLAEASGTKLKALEVANGHLAAVQSHMGSKGDIAGIYGAVRQESGLSFENEKDASRM